MYVKVVAWTLVLKCTFRNHIFHDAFLCNRPMLSVFRYPLKIRNAPRSSGKKLSVDA